MKDLLDPPQLPQAKVNKCLIALVGKKLVVKESVGVSSSCVYTGFWLIYTGVYMVQMGRNIDRIAV